MYSATVSKFVKHYMLLNEFVIFSAVGLLCKLEKSAEYQRQTELQVHTGWCLWLIFSSCLHLPDDMW